MPLAISLLGWLACRSEGEALDQCAGHPARRLSIFARAFPVLVDVTVVTSSPIREAALPR